MFFLFFSFFLISSCSFLLFPHWFFPSSTDFKWTRDLVYVSFFWSPFSSLFLRAERTFPTLESIHPKVEKAYFQNIIRVRLASLFYIHCFFSLTFVSSYIYIFFIFKVENVLYNPERRQLIPDTLVHVSYKYSNSEKKNFDWIYTNNQSMKSLHFLRSNSFHSYRIYAGI